MPRQRDPEQRARVKTTEVAVNLVVEDDIDAATVADALEEAAESFREY